MAGDWIKLRTALVTDGRVRIVAKKLKKSNALGNASTNAYSVTVLGALVTLWCLADAQADESGVLLGYDFDDINDLVGIENFCESLPADWIEQEEGWIKLPSYQTHNGKNAKKRAQTAKRVANARSNATSVTNSVPNALPREEKRRDKETSPRVSSDSSLAKAKFTPEDRQTAEQIFTLIRQLNPTHKQPKLDRWASTIRLMRQRDGRTHAEILAMFTWANNHAFWRTNILSPDKLRQQWDKLTIQRNSDKPGQSVVDLSDYGRGGK